MTSPRKPYADVRTRAPRLTAILAVAATLAACNDAMPDRQPSDLAQDTIGRLAPEDTASPVAETSEIPAASPASPDTAVLVGLPPALGREMTAPFELWVATFAPDEGSYPSGPRIVLITNDLATATVSVRGAVKALERTDSESIFCESGRTIEHTYEAGNDLLVTTWTMSPGAEACWVEGTVTFTSGTLTRVYRVKGASGV